MSLSTPAGVAAGVERAVLGAIEGQVRRLGVQWVRRDDLYQAAGELECTALALGRTADDCAEALLRNILFNGRIASLPPVAASRKGRLRLIQPLVYVGEETTAACAGAARACRNPSWPPLATSTRSPCSTPPSPGPASIPGRRRLGI